jgi:hypothetical protein
VGGRRVAYIAFMDHALIAFGAEVGSDPTVEGALRPGSLVRFRCDVERLLRTFGPSGWGLAVELNFYPRWDVVAVPLTFGRPSIPYGWSYADTTIPDSCERLALWLHARGDPSRHPILHFWDSRYGRNYWLVVDRSPAPSHAEVF